ncbi:hypothetical protein N7509_005060 [Penicillium cosmopolitanum]|uniref:Mid2 domain-containing protein n=1 Tax=Penicillium cosmopolitanum TaxID=1131564 RepID=A0A9X0B9R2_9EURO|nr:uncharacterized protein N7509_005060 [Penicillium cosmopolitanum]KAJ5396947.1 hypothetical protein N7509_005060 [Penicillium cosmopolitanum]
MSVGALTTTFTPAPSCTTESYGWWYYESSNLANSPQVTATDADVEWYLSLGPSVWKDCLPSNYATGSAYFSPGICPDGYTAAGQTSLAVDNEVVTAATCCPQGYNAQTGTDAYWYATNQCSSSNTDTGAEYTYTQGNVVTSYGGSYGVNAKGISIRWKEADFATTTTSSSPTTSRTSTSTSTSKASDFNSSAGLSPGAKAGIGVGVGLGVPLLLGVLYLIYLVRRNTARKEAAAAAADRGMSSHSGPSAPQPQPGYMPVNHDYGQQNMYEPSYEMSSDTHKDTPPQEMSTLRQ